MKKSELAMEKCTSVDRGSAHLNFPLPSGRRVIGLRFILQHGNDRKSQQELSSEIRRTLGPVTDELMSPSWNQSGIT